MSSRYIGIPSDRANYIKLKKIGMIPRYINQINEPTNNNSIDKHKVPFSKNYNTYQEYKDDLDKVGKFIERNVEIPDELIKKLEETAKELGIV